MLAMPSPPATLPRAYQQEPCQLGGQEMPSCPTGQRPQVLARTAPEGWPPPPLPTGPCGSRGAVPCAGGHRVLPALPAQTAPEQPKKQPGPWLCVPWAKALPVLAQHRPPQPRGQAWVGEAGGWQSQAFPSNVRRRHLGARRPPLGRPVGAAATPGQPVGWRLGALARAREASSAQRPVFELAFSQLHP